MNRAAGFTLIEVLVALAVLAIALAAGLKAVSAGARDLDHLRARTYGTWVAQNALAEIQLGLRGGGDRSDGLTGVEAVAGRRFVWAARVEPSRDASVDRLLVEAWPDTAEAAPVSALTGYRARELP